MPFVDLERGWTGKVVRIDRDAGGRIVRIMTRLDQAIEGKSLAVWDMRQANQQPPANRTE